MKRIIETLAGSVAMLLLTGTMIAAAPNSVGFVGSTPGDTLPREFLGGLPANAECHNITWQITLLTDQSTGGPTTYNVTAQYKVPTRAHPNRSEDGPKVTSHGTWDVIKGAKAYPDAMVYRLTSEKSQRSISFVKIGDNLLHLLNPDGTLLMGNSGWSYTLNRADHAEKPIDASLAAAAPDMSYPISPLATGTNVFAVFEGRSPCHGIARELKLPQHAGCTKVKWRITLYQNPETSAPTTYKIEGTLHRQKVREGTWSIVRGAKIDPKATVYQLNPTETEAALLLLKADDNILFFLDQNRELLVGHADFSYTLHVRK